MGGALYYQYIFWPYPEGYRSPSPVSLPRYVINIAFFLDFTPWKVGAPLPAEIGKFPHERKNHSVLDV